MKKEGTMSRICIVCGREMKNTRLKAAFRNVFSEDPAMIRVEGKKIFVHTLLDLDEKKVRKFAIKLGSYSKFKGKDDSYSFKLL